MPYVNSSAIARVDYDPQSRQMYIWFHASGGPYTYYNVPPHRYEGLLHATSVGSYFNSYIRDQYSVAR